MPDGFFKKNTSQIAFELELSEKSKRRYQKIISNYHSDDQYDFILYVCGSTALRYKLKKLTQGSRKTFLFMLYDDLMKNKEKAEVFGSDPGKLILRDLI